MTRAEDLAELGLDDSDEIDDRTICKACFRLAKERHPDKGGNEEAFQRLSNARERLINDAYAEEADERKGEEASPEEEHDYEEEEDYWYGENYNFFRRAWEYGFDDDEQEEEYDDYYTNWHEATAAARARQRRENLKAGYDYRDHRASEEDEKCMFCGVNQPITEESAIRNGLNWEEFCAHPEGYKTCWICKDNHISVMTKNMALQKFAKKLDFTATSKRTGVEHHPVFWFLKLNGRSFHHQPVTEYSPVPPRNSEYFWYPDLEMEALSFGWKPRGQKKEEVPWIRKDVSDETAIVARTRQSQSSTPKKKKATSKVVTPEKKKRRKKR